MSQSHYKITDIKAPCFIVGGFYAMVSQVCIPTQSVGTRKYSWGAAHFEEVFPAPNSNRLNQRFLIKLLALNYNYNVIIITIWIV